MKLILFEVYYRIFYTIGAITIIECFSYFVQGHQLEYLSGLLTFNYQAVDFDSCGDLKRNGLDASLSFDLKQDDCCLLFENTERRRENYENNLLLLKQQYLDCYSWSSARTKAESCGLDIQSNNFLALSSNEGRAWVYLFIVYLSYFYSLEVDKTTLSNVLLYIKGIYFCILIIIHTYTICTPGLLKKWVADCFFILTLIILILLCSKFGVFILITSFEELLLEQLDSELL